MGIVMMGTGAYAAANAGVLRVLGERAIEPYAVCGMQDGAWLAALHVSGCDAVQMDCAISVMARGAGRLFRPVYSSGALMSGKTTSLCDGRRLERLLKIQVGERILSVCERRGIFPCRIAATGRRVVFTTRAYVSSEDCELSQHATLSFAARAAMACPPFLSPLPWLGSCLLPEEDSAWAAEQLLRMGADRVLIVEPRAAMGRNMDALELATARRRWDVGEAGQLAATVIRIPMPVTIGALDYSCMAQLAQAGYDAASVQMDAALQGLGMTQCRILPFRARVQQTVSRR